MLSPEPVLIAGFDHGLGVLASALRALLEGLSLGTVLLGLLVTLRQAWLAWRRRFPGGTADLRQLVGDGPGVSAGS